MQEVQGMIGLPYRRDCFCSIWLYKYLVALFKAQGLYEVFYSSFSDPLYRA